MQDDDDQFERDEMITDFSKQEAFMAAKLPETNERGELLTAPPAERRDNFLGGPPQDIEDGMMNASRMSESVIDESQMMREQRNSFINDFNQKKEYKTAQVLGEHLQNNMGPLAPDMSPYLNNLNINSQESIEKKGGRDPSPDMLNMLDELKGGRESGQSAKSRQAQIARDINNNSHLERQKRENFLKKFN